MPATLDKPGLKTGIKNLMAELYINAGGLTPEQCQDRYADQMSNLIDVFVKSGTVTVAVATTGTAAAQTGTGTGNVT